MLIGNPSDRKIIKDALHEISGALTRTEAEKDLVKEIINDISTKYLLPKKMVTRLARLYHKQNFQEEQAEQSELETLYTDIMESKAENNGVQ